MARVRVGSVLKLRSFTDELFGSCKVLAELDDVDLTSHLEVTKVVQDGDFTFVHFLHDAPNLSGSSIDRFDVVTY